MSTTIIITYANHTIEYTRATSLDWIRFNCDGFTYLSNEEFASELEEKILKGWDIQSIQ